MTDTKNIIKLIINDKFFGGFEKLYILHKDDTIDCLIETILFDLRNCLATNKLYSALQVLDKKKFCINEKSIEDLLKNQKNDKIVYVSSY